MWKIPRLTQYQVNGITPLKHIGTALILCFMVMKPCTAKQLSVQIVTEQLAPLQIDNGDKPPSGAMVEVIQTLLNNTEIAGKIEVFPWSRAYLIARHQPNTLIFSIIRNPEREQQFHWIGSLLKGKAYLMRLKDRPELAISTIEEAKSYRVGVHRLGISEQYLLEKGFTGGKNLLFNSDYSKLWESLFQEKVDYILANKFMWAAKKKEQSNTYRPLAIALTLDDFAKDYYLAASIDTSPIIINKLQKALENLKQSGQYQAILEKWQLAD